MDEKCEKCDISKYGYTDGIHSIYLCYKCGRYEGVSGGDEVFIDQIADDPMILLDMIKDKTLIPIR